MSKSNKKKSNCVLFNAFLFLLNFKEKKRFFLQKSIFFSFFFNNGDWIFVLIHGSRAGRMD